MPGPTMALGRAGLAFGCVGPLGPTVAWLATWAREEPVLARHVGTPSAARPEPPVPWLVDGAVVVFWCEDDGVHAQRLEAERAWPARLVLPAAERVAVAAGLERATVFGADSGGLLHVEVDAWGAPLGALRRTAAERQAPPLLVATRVRDEAVAVFAYRGSPTLGVLSVRRAEQVRVKHPLREPCADLGVGSSAGRAAIALGLESGAVQVAVLGADGVMVERPHPVLAREGSRYDSPRVVFSEDDWALLARAPDENRLLVQPLGSRGTRFELPDCRAPFAAAYWARHFFALEASAAARALELRLWRCARDGSSPEHRVLPLALTDADVRRVETEARAVLLVLAERVSRGQGYRDEAPQARVLGEGASLVLADRDRELRLALYSEGALVRLVVALGPPGLALARGARARASRWAGGWLSGAGRRESARDRAWASALAEELGARRVRVERDGAVVELDVGLERVPSADALAAWVQRLRREG